MIKKFREVQQEWGDEEQRKERKIELKKEKKNKKESKSSMTPWEQHASVISIPRFNYNPPSSLFQCFRSTFLITCTIKREKGATKEAIYIFSNYIGSFNSGTSVEPLLILMILKHS